MTVQIDPLRLLIDKIFDYNTARELAVRNSRLAREAKRAGDMQKFHSSKRAACDYNTLCSIAHNTIYKIVGLLTKSQIDNYMETMCITLGSDNHTPAMVYLRKCIDHLGKVDPLPFDSLIEGL